MHNHEGQYPRLGGLRMNTSSDALSRQPIVLKFGGAALADGGGIQRVGAILASRGGPRPVAVVSAAAGVTELLIQVAQAAAEGRSELERVRVRHRTLLSQCGLEQELLNRLLAELAAVLEGIRERRAISAAERDFVLSFGERMSTRVVAAALRAGGRNATPVDAFDLGLISDSNHGCARPLAGTSSAIRRALAEVPGIPVVTGFVAKDAAGNLTTLGRNGSDLSASLLADACGAREVQFWKVVGGVMSADPTLVPDARGIARLSYAQAAEYAFAFEGKPTPFPASQSLMKLAGDHDVFGDGSVVIFSTPGHTPGHQSLMVTLPKTGVILLTGDAVHFKDNWDNKRVPSMNTDKDKTVASMTRLEGLMAQHKAQLWINHDKPQSDGQKHAPEFYE